MRKSRMFVALVLGLGLCSLPSLASTHVPATANKSFQSVPCFFGWMDSAATKLVFVAAETSYQARFEDGSMLTMCFGKLNFGEPTQVRDLFGNVSVETLASPGVVCNVFPAACTSSVNQVIRFNFSVSGTKCIENNVPSDDYQQLVAPDGRSIFFCKYDPNQD